MTVKPYVNILPVDTAPWFNQRTGSNPCFTFDTAAVAAARNRPGAMPSCPVPR
jgi:hypothetical protein